MGRSSIDSRSPTSSTKDAMSPDVNFEACSCHASKSTEGHSISVPPHPASLPPLDLDELSPLPPAQNAFLSPRAALSSHFGIQSKASLRSLKSSPVPSSFRLDGSPVQRPSYQQSPLALRPTSTASERSSIDDGTANGFRERPSHVQTASYVTVSAILSRSEMYLPGGSGQRQLLKGSFSGRDHHPSGANHVIDSQGDSDPRYSLRRRPSKKGPSTGSAVEALGALLLHRDSLGRVSNLSFTREDGGNQVKGRKALAKTFSHALNELGKMRLGLNLPGGGKEESGSSSGTIAERRARMWNKLSNRKGSSEESAEGDFRKVRSAKGGLSFDVGNKSSYKRPTIILESGKHPGEASKVPFSATIMLKADVRPSLRRQYLSKYGFGSSFNAADLPEAPPSPIDMPGAWHGGSSWRAKPGDGFEEGALLLPPPLLDDQGSDPRSFEGLLGVRRLREQEKARKQMERLKARNRPTHKVGPFTALVNFVKAAHAAETSAKSAQLSRPAGLSRTMSELTQPASAVHAMRRSSSLVGHLQTGPLTSNAVMEVAEESESDEDQDVSDLDSDSGIEEQNGDLTAKDEKEPTSDGVEISKSKVSTSTSPTFRPNQRRHTALSRKGSRANSVELGGRQLNTVFEAESFDPLALPRLDATSPDLPPLSSPYLRPSSRSSSTLSLKDLPAAPKLLPVQMSLPPSPFTPLGIDHARSQSKDRRSSNSSLASDYWSARPLNGQPLTPRLGPTVLSVPPSPWTLHQDAGGQMYQLHFNASSTSLRLPGTPRLIPTHLEVLPSPFPTPGASRRSSLQLNAEGHSLTSVMESPSALKARSMHKSPLSNAIDSFTLEPQPLEKGTETSDASSPNKEGKLRKRRGLSKRKKAIVDEQSARLTPSYMFDDPTNSEVSTPTPQAPAQASPTPDLTPTISDLQTFPEVEDVPEPQSAPPSSHPRSFLLWFLIGDIFLRSNDSKDAADYGFVAGIFIHLLGFCVFCLAHLVDLAYIVAENASLTFWFLRWLFLNLTCQTVLAQCAVEAYRLIQAEWATVAEEDHEGRGAKCDGEGKPRGLTRWQVVRGLVELFCLHSVTRERYLEEGAGLVKLEGWSRRDRKAGIRSNQEDTGRLDIGAQKAAARAALADEALAQSETKSDDSNYDEDEEDSSDEEMIVTNRGDDILEFSKTPRLDSTRPGQHRKHSGYFGTPYDTVTSPQIKSSSSDVPSDFRALRESNKELIKTIKWASRLAISAYGLHVHIVDLPPTFTPSGDRFSRQTFAYLSRLDANDVLHADIQTLDADADYSPTFYIVRDYIRKVVCVAVRGTQSFSDIIVDLEMRTEEVELPQVQPAPGEEFRCHAGIWRAAKALVAQDSKLFEKLRVALEENEGFGVIFCGHSLGGAIASAAALLLGEYRVPDGVERDQGSWFTNSSSGLPAHRPIRAISFANPVTVTADLASRAAMGSIPLVTTVVLGSDLIPRAGHGQVRELRRVLGALSRVRRRHALAGKEDARVHIIRSYWDWRSISRLPSNEIDDVLCNKKEAIEEQLWSLRREVEGELYSAVRAKMEDGVPPSPWVGPSHSASLHMVAERRQALDSTTLRSEAAQGGPLVPAGRCIWIEGNQVFLVTSPLSFFSLPELRAGMFAMHFPAAYEEAILNLRT